MIATGVMNNIFGVHVDASDNVQAGTMMFILLAVTLVNTAVMVYMLKRTAWSGWKLVGVIVWVFWGLNSFMTQIEGWFFNDALQMPGEMMLALASAVLVQSVVFALVAVTVFKRWQPEKEQQKTLMDGVKIPGGELVIKLLFLAVLFYSIVYYLFGYYVLWQIEEARVVYAGTTEILPFFAHTNNVLRNNVWLWPWQVMRAFIFISFAWLVMKKSTANWVETGLLVGLLFAVLMNMQQWIPNPYLPLSVRAGHFWETVPSNFIWGFVIVWLLHRSHRSPGELLQ